MQCYLIAFSIDLTMISIDLTMMSNTTTVTGHAGTTKPGNTTNEARV